jgi:hypothetical protein
VIKPSPASEKEMVHLIDLLSDDDEEDGEPDQANAIREVDEIDISIDEDININSAILKEVVPKEMKSGSRPPVIIAGMLAFDASEAPSSAVARNAIEGDCDWDTL